MQESFQSHYQTSIDASFSEIASKSYFFIDKSNDIMKLLKLDSNNIMILRPAKFGKTIMLDMIEDYFMQEKSNFEKLKCNILQTINFSQENSFKVIKFKLRTEQMTVGNFNDEILNEIKKNFYKYDIKGFENFSVPYAALEYLISNLTMYGKTKIVVLIDDIESILLFVKYNTEIFQSILKSIQNIFEVLKRWKESFHFLLLLGTANFYQLSDLVKDYTFRPETSSVFGFNIPDVLNSNIFYNKLGEQIKLSKTQVKVFGFFQHSLQRIYDNALLNFHFATKYDLNGQVNIEFLFYLILHSGGYRFSQQSSDIVINPVDFVFSLKESKIGEYWLQYIFEHYPSDFFYNSFPFGSEVIEKCLLNLIVRGNSLSINDLFKYQYLIPLGFISFQSNSLTIPNLVLFDYIVNCSIKFLYSKCTNKYTDIQDSPFNKVLEKMPIFPEYKNIPTIIFKNNCWDYIMLYYLYHVFPDIKIQIGNDGTFIVMRDTFILSLFFEGDVEKRLSILESETNRQIIVVKITVNSINNMILIETCFRFKGELKRYKMDFYNPNFYYVTQIFPFLYTQEEIKRANKEKIQEPSKFVSFSDLVKDALNDIISIDKKEFASINLILNNIVKKAPHLASEKNLRKSILLALYYLSKTGFVKYRTNKEGLNEYTLVNFKLLKNIP